VADHAAVQLLLPAPVVALNAASAEPKGAMVRAAIEIIAAATVRCGVQPRRDRCATEGVALAGFPVVPLAEWV
jgi:hypothetical protein